MVCDSARTSVIPALISIAMESIMKVFPISKKRNGIQRNVNAENE